MLSDKNGNTLHFVGRQYTCEEPCSLKAVNDTEDFPKLVNNGKKIIKEMVRRGQANRTGLSAESLELTTLAFNNDQCDYPTVVEHS